LKEIKCHEYFYGKTATKEELFDKMNHLKRAMRKDELEQAKRLKK